VAAFQEAGGRGGLLLIFLLYYYLALLPESGWLHFSARIIRSLTKRSPPHPPSSRRLEEEADISLASACWEDGNGKLAADTDDESAAGRYEGGRESDSNGMLKEPSFRQHSPHATCKSNLI